jgi:hypothetical protein
MVLQQPSVLLCAEHIERNGIKFLRLACNQDLEGIVPKYNHAPTARSGLRPEFRGVCSTKAGRVISEQEADRSSKADNQDS